MIICIDKKCQMQPRKFDFSIKTIIVGDSGVGKTCLILRFIRDYFEESSQPTLGVEFTAKIITTEKHRIELQLWDTAGQELFRSVTRGYYRGSSGAFLVFDLTNRLSFDNIGRWLNDVKDSAHNDVVLVLIGNKLDCASDRAVSKEEAQAFADFHHMKYFETSAKSGENVEQAMIECLKIIEKKADSGEITLPSAEKSIIYDSDNNETKSKSCCG